MHKHKKRIPLIAGILFLLTAIFAVTSAWITGFHRYDLSLSFSAYVGVDYASSVIYGVAALLMLPLLMFYIFTTKMPSVKKLVYALVFFCIAGTALFPFNAYSDHCSTITSGLHKVFAIALMLVGTVSFLLLAILSQNRTQRVAALCLVGYAVAFIALYYIEFGPMYQTFFIWETLLILLFPVELQVEQYGELACVQEKRRITAMLVS